MSSPVFRSRQTPLEAELTNTSTSEDPLCRRQQTSRDLFEVTADTDRTTQKVFGAISLNNNALAPSGEKILSFAQGGCELICKHTDD
jgi:hypothetical protein